MIKNLVVNGCSFTQGKSWAHYVNSSLTPSTYKNLAQGGAGNFYIANSTIDYLASAQLNPAETIVVIMWSGTGRKDIRLSGEWYYHLKQGYRCCISNSPDEYYLFSGGLTNSWITNSSTKQIFEWAYKLADPVSLCKDSLSYIVNLESYLKANQYQYRFAGYVNQWNHAVESSPITGDYCMDYFLQDVPAYKNYSFDQWVFIDRQRNCLGEFANQLGEMDCTSHPTSKAHKLFAEQFVIPALNFD